MWEGTTDLQIGLDDSFAGMEGEGIDIIQRSELLLVTKEGHQILYKDYVATDIEGDKFYGVIAVFYCDESQKVFQLITASYTSGSKQGALAEFDRFLNSFICH